MDVGSGECQSVSAPYTNRRGSGGNSRLVRDPEERENQGAKVTEAPGGRATQEGGQSTEMALRRRKSTDDFSRPTACLEPSFLEGRD